MQIFIPASLVASPKAQQSLSPATLQTPLCTLSFAPVSATTGPAPPRISSHTDAWAWARGAASRTPPAQKHQPCLSDSHQATQKASAMWKNIYTFLIFMPSTYLGKAGHNGQLHPAQPLPGWGAWAPPNARQGMLPASCWARKKRQTPYSPMLMAQITKIKLQLKNPEQISKLHFTLSLLLPLNRVETYLFFLNKKKNITTTES